MVSFRLIDMYGVTPTVRQLNEAELVNGLQALPVSEKSGVKNNLNLTRCRSNISSFFISLCKLLKKYD